MAIASTISVGFHPRRGLSCCPLDGLEHILLQVLGVFDTAANPHEVIEDTNGLALVLGNTSMCHAAGHLHERLHAAKRLGQCENLGQLAEPLRGGMAALNAEAQHAATHAVTVLFLGNVPVRVAFEARVVDGDNAGVGLERCGDGGRIASGFSGAQVQCLEATVGQPGVEGGGDGADGVL